MPTLTPENLANIWSRIITTEKLLSKLSKQFDYYHSFFLGKQWLQQIPNDPRITANYTLPIIRTKLAFLKSIEPYISVSVSPNQYTPNLSQQDIEDNIANAILAIWQEIDALSQIHQAALDALIYGSGFVTTMWLYESENYSQWNIQPEQQEIQKISLSSPPPNYDNVYIKAIPPYFMLIDPSANSLKEAQWCCWIQKIPIEIAKKIPYIPDKLKNNPDTPIPGYPQYSEDVKSFLNLNVSPSSGFITLYNYWQKTPLYDPYVKPPVNIILSKNMKHQPLLVQTSPYDFPHYSPFPFEQLIIHPNNSSPYGISEVELLIPQQRERNLIRERMAKVIRSLPRILFPEGYSLSPEAKNALEFGDDNVIVELPQNVLQQVTPLPIPPLRPEIFTIDQYVEKDMNNISGISSILMGTQLSGRRSATEVMSILQKGDARIDDLTLTYSQFLSSVAQKTYLLLKTFHSGVRNLSFISESGRKFSSILSEEILTPDASVKVSADPVRKQKELLGAQNIIQALAMMQQLPIQVKLPLIEALFYNLGLAPAWQKIAPTLQNILEQPTTPQENPENQTNPADILRNQLAQLMSNPENI